MIAHSEVQLHGRSRRRLRALKRLAREGSGTSASPALRLQSQAIALVFLDRSIKFKHRRLAVLRLKDAAELGAPIEEVHWDYCWNVVECSDDVELHSEFLKAQAFSRDGVQNRRSEAR